MKLQTVSVGKSMKVGLPNYSSADCRVDLTFNIDEDEDVNWDGMWDEVNHQLFTQVGNIDPSWIEHETYADYTKVILKVPKNFKNTK